MGAEILAKKPTMPGYLKRRERPWFRQGERTVAEADLPHRADSPVAMVLNSSAMAHTSPIWNAPNVAHIIAADQPQTVCPKDGGVLYARYDLKA